MLIKVLELLLFFKIFQQPFKIGLPLARSVVIQEWYENYTNAD